MEELIASGKLELYITDSLLEKERDEIIALLKKHPELKQEIEKIERNLLSLGAALAPPIPSQDIHGNRRITKEQGVNWKGITGWSAAILCILALFWSINKKNNIQNDFNLVNTQNVVLKEDTAAARSSLEAVNKVLAVFRNKAYTTIILPGNQAVAPDAYVKVYFNNKEGIAFIDVSGLPVAPADKEYQVWSLLMDPLTPSSMGIINEKTAVSSEYGVYKFENVPKNQAFGITLEPKGGSEFPTLTQLYTLGTISAP